MTYAVLAETGVGVSVGQTWPRGVSNLAIDEVSLALILFFSSTALTESAINCSVTDDVMLGATVADAAASAAAAIDSNDGGSVGDSMPSVVTYG